ncbi:MAG: hypothetical protein EXS14_01570 [Planctomycetes bacterium]|nr:hypothetical protein [Planctomycetota bacterium]
MDDTSRAGAEPLKNAANESKTRAPIEQDREWHHSFTWHQTGASATCAEAKQEQLSTTGF